MHAHEDLRLEGGVRPELQACPELRHADEPRREEVTRVEGEVQKPREVTEEGVGEVLRLIEDEKRSFRSLVDHLLQATLQLPPQGGPPVRGPQPELQCERAVQIERPDRGVAEVDDAVLRPRQGLGEVSDRGRLPDAGLGGQESEAWLLAEELEATLELLVAFVLGEEGLFQ